MRIWWENKSRKKKDNMRIWYGDEKDNNRNKRKDKRWEKRRNMMGRYYGDKMDDKRWENRYDKNMIRDKRIWWEYHKGWKKKYGRWI